MKNSKSYAAVLAGVLVGVTVGAGAVYTAQSVSYRYSDRDTFRVIREKNDLHDADHGMNDTATHRAAAERYSIPENCMKFSGKRQALCIQADQDDAFFTGRHYQK